MKILSSREYHRLRRIERDLTGIVDQLLEALRDNRITETEKQDIRRQTFKILLRYNLDSNEVRRARSSDA